MKNPLAIAPIPPLFLAFALSLIADQPARAHGVESMTRMPLARQKQSFIVTGREDLEVIRGFGEKEGEVGMMNLMMVEGSGMEGMAMPSPSSPARPRVAERSAPFQLKVSTAPSLPGTGSNRLDFQLVDPGSGKSVAGVKLRVQVFMSAMNMGTEEPAVSELQPGHYQVNVVFSMRGSWVVSIRDTDNTWEKLLHYEVGG